MSIVKFLGYVTVLLTGYNIGRYGYKIWRDEYLESKRQELYGYRDQLLLLEKAIEHKDEEVRKKWQAMVADFANYKAYAEPEGTNKWSEWDDVYLNSWSSAEK